MTNLRYIVCTGPVPSTWFLCGTYWTGQVQQATEYPTRQAADEALEAAEPFTTPEAFRTAQVRLALTAWEQSRLFPAAGGLR